MTKNKVFEPTSTQSQVFEEVSQLVQSALDGYCVSIFAYGQTGSGKTFTMEGPPDKLQSELDMGVIPRTVHKIFETAESLAPMGWKYTMEAQYIEIYNENIRDLLGDQSENRHEIKYCALTSKTYVTNVRSGMYARVPNALYLLTVPQMHQKLLSKLPAKCTMFSLRRPVTAFSRLLNVMSTPLGVIGNCAPE